MTNSLVLSVLESIKAARGLESNYALAKHLGIRDTALAHYVHGRSLPDEKACKKIAFAAGIDSDIFTAQIQSLRAKDDETRAIWQRIAARLQVAGTAVFGAILSVLISTVLIAPDAYAASAGDIDTNSKSELALYTSWILWLTLFFLLLTWLRPGMVQPVTFPWVPTA